MPRLPGASRGANLPLPPPKHGYPSERGVLYFAQARSRVDVPFDEALMARTLALLDEARQAAARGVLHPTHLERIEAAIPLHLVDVREPAASHAADHLVEACVIDLVIDRAPMLVDDKPSFGVRSTEPAMSNDGLCAARSTDSWNLLQISAGAAAPARP